MKLGYFISSEESGPREIVAQAVKAREAGFDRLWISDHFHPWNEEQGHASFVWGALGAISQAAPGMHVTTAVTCPTVRIHPAILAQAAATASLLLDGRFNFGVGTGEALNEQILGDHWPEAAVRRELLEEAVEVIRLLWQGGFRSHRGRHYRVHRARIYDLPERPPKIIVSAFGEKSLELAARIGDGFCTTKPDADGVSTFRTRTQRSDTITQAGLKVCYASDEAQARGTVYRLWAMEALPGELAQILPTPRHFEQATQLVTEEMATEDVPCGPDIDAHLEAIGQYSDAGFDELYINQIGPEQDAFFAAYKEEVLPRFAGQEDRQKAAAR